MVDPLISNHLQGAFSHSSIGFPTTARRLDQDEAAPNFIVPNDCLNKNDPKKEHAQSTIIVMRSLHFVFL
jgi:hypothetical protein